MVWPWQRELTQWEKARAYVEENGRYFIAAGVAVGLLLASRPRFWRRIPNVDFIPVSHWQKRKTLTGVVTRVGDGDGFHLYHRVSLLFSSFVPLSCSLNNGQPLLHRLFPMPSKVPQKQISIRLAGVDAPECAHFGLPGQRYGEEAKAFLTKELMGRTVKVQVLKRDQYGRCVAMAWVNRTFWWQNVSSLLVSNGFATLYEGAGAEYGGMRSTFETLEKQARKRRVGMWAGKEAHKESPMDFKKRTKSESAKES
jgi:endonuclease YncB( thermonuclease family)